MMIKTSENAIGITRNVASKSEYPNRFSASQKLKRVKYYTTSNENA